MVQFVSTSEFVKRQKIILSNGKHSYNSRIPVFLNVWIVILDSRSLPSTSKHNAFIEKRRLLMGLEGWLWATCGEKMGCK